ncbi:ATP-dependent zinc metalloprotease FtsH 2, partial [Dissostichus eleginoides]
MRSLNNTTLALWVLTVGPMASLGRDQMAPPPVCQVEFVVATREMPHGRGLGVGGVLPPPPHVFLSTPSGTVISSGKTSDTLLCNILKLVSSRLSPPAKDHRPTSPPANKISGPW